MLKTKWFLRWPIQIIFFLLTLLYGISLDLPLPFSLLLGVAGWALLYAASTDVSKLNFAQHKPLLMLCGGMTLFFFLILPATALLDTGAIAQWAYPFPIPALLYRAIKLGEKAFRLLLTGALVFSLLLVVVRRLPHIPARTPVQPWTFRFAAPRVLLYALPYLFLELLPLYAYWPGILSTDSFAQWEMIDDLGKLYDWHPVIHTLFEYALTRLWYSPAIIVLFQILVLAFILGLILSFFEAHGIRSAFLFLASVVFSLLPYNMILPMTLWKDVLYADFNVLLVFLLGLVWYTRGQWLHKARNQVLLGIFIGLPFLFRHNGILILALTPVALLFLFRSHWKAILTATGIAVLLVLGLRNGLAFGLLKARPNPDSVLYVVPIQHISAVVAAGGRYTEAQEAVLEKIAPIETWRKAYIPFYADSMTKSWGATKDKQVIEKIDQNLSGLIQIFLDFSIRYPRVVAQSELDLTSLQWRITTQSGYMSYVYDYSLTSINTDGPIIPALFDQPHINSPIRAFMDRYLSTSHQNPILYPLFWKGGVYLFLTLLFLIQLRPQGKDAWILFVPSLANMASLALTMPVQNFRYIYPWVLSTLVIGLFHLVQRPAAEENPHNV